MNFLFMKDFSRRLIALSAPIAVQQAVFTGVNLVDNLMIGQISQTSLAAAAVAGQVYFLVMLFLFGITSGSAILMSQFFGAHNLRGIRHSMALGLVTAAPGIGFIMIVSMAWPEVLLGLFTNDPAVIALAVPYQRIIALSYPATLMTNSLSATLRSTREVKLPMVASSTALILNTLGNIVLINGFLGFPRLGLFGAGIATLIARWIETGLIVVFTLGRRRWLFWKIRGWFDFTRDFVRKYYRITLPVVGNELFWSIGFSSYLAVFGRISTAALAAYNIQEMAIRIFIIIFVAIGNGGAILLGNTLGAGKQDLAHSYALKIMTMGPVLALLFSGLSLILAPILPGFYTISPESQEIAVQMLRLLAIILPFKVLNIVNIVAIFRSGGDTVFSLYMDVGVLWLIGVPLAFLSGLVWKVNPAFVLLIASSEEVVKAFIGIYRVRSRKWIHVFTGRSTVGRAPEVGA